MTIGELKQLLEKYTDDEEVFIGYYDWEYRAWEYIYADEVNKYTSPRDSDLKGIVIS